MKAMLIKEFQEFITNSFTQEKLDIVKENGEYGFTNSGKPNISKVGYCTNFTVETAKEAVKNNIDLLITHHDAWESMLGMRETAVNILKESGISHFFIHLPLDDADFGNNTSFLKKLGISIVDKFCIEDGMYCGRIGELECELDLCELVNQVESLLSEPVRSWKNNERKIKRVGVVTGAGFSSSDVKEAADLECDVYITGEKMLNTVLYAQFRKINLIVTSHTFIEIYGLESLMIMLKEKHSELNIIRINEDRIE